MKVRAKDDDALFFVQICLASLRGRGGGKEGRKVKCNARKLLNDTLYTYGHITHMSRLIVYNFSVTVL